MKFVVDEIWRTTKLFSHLTFIIYGTATRKVAYLVIHIRQLLYQRQVSVLKLNSSRICWLGIFHGTERNGIISRNFQGIKYGTELQSRGVFLHHALSSFTGLYTSCAPCFSVNE